MQLVDILDPGVQPGVFDLSLAKVVTPNAEQLAREEKSLAELRNNIVGALEQPACIITIGGQTEVGTVGTVINGVQNNDLPGACVVSPDYFASTVSSSTNTSIEIGGIDNSSVSTITAARTSVQSASITVGMDANAPQAYKSYVASLMSLFEKTFNVEGETQPVQNGTGQVLKSTA